MNKELIIEKFNHQLKNEFLKRTRFNKNYSLRAFAKYLDVDPSHLSKVFNGNMNFGYKKMFKIRVKLNLKDFELNSLSYEKVNMEHFEVINDWYYYAILELMKNQDFQNDYAWIASRLGISAAEAKAAVDKLFHLGILKQNENGTWYENGSGTSSTINLEKDYTNEVLKKNQKELLQKATEAMDEVSVNYRSQTSTTMAVSKEKILSAKKLILKFQREMTELLADKGRPSEEVYTLAISLFPLTKIDTSKESI